MSKLTTQPAVNLLSLMEDFDTDAECRAYLEELRWPKGVTCPRCQSQAISRIKARKMFDCDGCRYQFSVTAGTIFHDSHLPLPKWFMAIFLITESKKGMSARQLKRLLKVSYKTAWYLCHRIREAMKTENAEPLTGIVECDETYVGGKQRGVGMGGYHLSKALVIGIIQRGGELRIRHGRSLAPNRKTLHGFIKEHAPNPKRIMTDEHLAYKCIKDSDTTHETVTHSKKEYVRGDVHTNTIESAFGLFKRSLVGSFHKVSVKHLDRYLDEFEFRYNNRKNAYLFRDTLIRLTNGTALPYEKLTKSA
jgi:transposase-like protein